MLLGTKQFLLRYDVSPVHGTPLMRKPPTACVTSSRGINDRI